jgi:hypothetical protein
MRRKFPLVIGVLLAAHSSAFGQEAPSAKVARLLNDTGVKLTKIKENTWTLPFQGESMKDITVFVAVGGDLLVTFALIRESKDVKFPPEVLRELLLLNETYDRVKVGIDKEGIVFVRSDISVRTLDQKDMSASIDQVAAAVDEVHENIRSHLPKAK